MLLSTLNQQCNSIKASDASKNIPSEDLLNSVQGSKASIHYRQIIKLTMNICQLKHKLHQQLTWTGEMYE